MLKQVEITFVTKFGFYFLHFVLSVNLNLTKLLIHFAIIVKKNCNNSHYYEKR